MIKRIIVLEFLALILGIAAMLSGKALVIFIFMTVGNLLMLTGLVLYIALVLKDLKTHRVL